MSAYTVRTLVTGQEIRILATPEFTAFHPGDICHLLGIEDQDSIWPFVEFEDMHLLSPGCNGVPKDAPIFMLSENGLKQLVAKTATPEAKDLREQLKAALPEATSLAADH